MKRVAFIVIGILLVFRVSKSASAACYTTDTGTGYQTRVDTQLSGQQRILTFTPANGTGRTIVYNPEQCGGVPPPSTTVYCDTDTDMYAADSVRAPVCGSTPERERANSTCYDCGSGITKCDGLDYALGDTSSFLTDTANRGKVDPNDADDQINNVWRVNSVPTDTNTFFYNGKSYPVSPTIILCDANNQACGASEACTNLMYGNIDNRGNNPYLPTQTTQGTAPTAQAIIDVISWPTAGQTMNFPDKFLHFFGLTPTLVKSLAALIRFDNFQHFVPGFLRPMGIALDQVASHELMPSALQKQLSRPYEGGKTPVVPYNTGWRICFPGAKVDGREQSDMPLEGYNKSEDSAVREFIGQGDPIDEQYYNKAIWSTRYLAAIFTKPSAKLPSLDFRFTDNATPVPIEGRSPCIGDVCHENNIEALDAILAPCGAPYSGRTNPQIANEARGVTRPEGGNEGNIFTIGLTYFISLVGDLEACPSDKENPPIECKTKPITATSTDFFPAGCSIDSATKGPGNDTNAFCPLASTSEKQAIKDAGGEGWLNSLWPAALPEFRNTNAKIRQVQALGETGFSRNKPRDATPARMEGIREADECIRYNAIVPSTLIDPAKRCTLTQNGEPYPGTANRGVAQWTTQSTIPPSFQITDTNVKAAVEEATKDQIPACVLEGVKFIESGTDWTSSQSCSVNNCSAAGPFQITTGWAPDPNAPGGWDNHCRMCGGNDTDSSWIDGKRNCPDGWEGNWPMTPTDPSPCEAGPAAKQATAMLIAKSAYWTNTVLGESRPLNSTDSIQSQRDAIMLAGDSYWGKTATIERLGGCTYGEYVYKHCDPSYQCTGNPPVSLPQ